MTIPNRILLHLFTLFIGFSAYSQQYNFKNYGTKNGLAGATVNAIFQDSRGFMWFGGIQGVSKFDGKSFTNFSTKDGLIANNITSIAEDKVGNIWIATTEGVSEYDGKLFRNFTTKNGLSDNQIFNIYVDNKNTIWFATGESGILFYDGKTFGKLTTKDGLTSNYTYAITQDKEGIYWFALNNGVAKFDGNKITSYHDIPELNKKDFFSSFSDSKGNCWFGGFNNIGVVKYSNQKFSKFELPKEFENDFIGCIAEDKKQNIWFATDHGALKYDGEKFEYFTEYNGLSANSVTCLYSDNENNIWIGTTGGGVNLFNNESFVTYTDKQGLASNKINALLNDNNNRLLAGIQGGGINMLKQKNFVFANANDEFANVSVLAISQNKQNEYWIGTDNAGVYVLEEKGNKFSIKHHFEKFDNCVANKVWKILFDKQGNTWLADFGSGLFLINKKNEIKNYSIKNNFPSNSIITLFEDSRDDIWIGTIDAGVIKYSNGKFNVYSEKQGLANKEVWSIAEDNNHRLYFGTHEGGISCYDGKKFKTISTTDGLCSNYILTLLWDDIDKCLWAGTDKGINKIKFDNNFNIIQPLRYYGEHEGFKGVELNANAICMDKESTIWFGTNNGLCAYNRKFDFPNTAAPTVYLSEIRLNYQTVNWKKFADSVDEKTNIPKNLKLSYKNNHLTFNFQALTTDNVKYTYILEGQDNEWSPLSYSTEANFTNITAGKNYSFKIKAVNSSGVWSNKIVEFNFAISPPWYQTWWFYLLVVTIVSISIYTFIKYRTAKLVQDKKHLEEKVEERTTELKETNTKLSVAFQDIKDSINYAKIIQEAILPLEAEIKKELPQSFVIFKPRDVVSGDFYWFNTKEDKIYIACVDCTGHGVPGAFMSMIGSSLLNEIVNENVAIDAGYILNKLHKGVRKSLKQDRERHESNDGMDMALMIIDLNSNIIDYAGAKRPLWYLQKPGELIEVKPDKQSIGGHQMDSGFRFTNHKIEIKKEMQFFMFTDGVVDQFGGDDEKKFSSKRLKEVLISIFHLNATEQHKALDKTIIDWKKHTEQIDDILLIGIRILEN